MNDQLIDYFASGSHGSAVVSPAGDVLLTERPYDGDAGLGSVGDATEDIDAVRHVAAAAGSTALVRLPGGLDDATIVLGGDVAVTLTSPTGVMVIRPLPGEITRHVVSGDVVTMALQLGGPASGAEAAELERWDRSPRAGDRVVLRAVAPVPDADRSRQPEDRVELIDLDGPPSELGEALPLAPLPPPDVGVAQVLGIRCPVGHHNHPDAQYCSTCGRKMGVNATAVLVIGPRPPVGLFLTDDGMAIPIAGDLLLGREPATHPDVAAGRRRGIVLSDDSAVLSRHHVAVTLDGWDVAVTDLGSGNGTTVRSGRTGLEHRLEPGRPVVLTSGDRVLLGPVALRLSLHHIDSTT